MNLFGGWKSSLFVVVCSTTSVFAADAPPVEKVAAAESTASDDTTVEQFLQSLSRVPDVTNRRDPFAPLPAPYQAMLDAQKTLVTKPEDLSKVSPLERHPVKDYKVIAILLGDVYPRALVRLPAAEGNKVVIIKEKDKLGNLKGVVSKISGDGLAVIQRQVNMDGEIEKAEVRLALEMPKRSDPPPAQSESPSPFMPAPAPVSPPPPPPMM